MGNASPWRLEKESKVLYKELYLALTTRYVHYLQRNHAIHTCTENARKKKQECVNVTMPHDAWSKRLLIESKRATSDFCEASNFSKGTLKQRVCQCVLKQKATAFKKARVLYSRFLEVSKPSRKRSCWFKRFWRSRRQTAETKSHASRQSMLLYVPYLSCLGAAIDSTTCLYEKLLSIYYSMLSISSFIVKIIVANSTTFTKLEIISLVSTRA